MKKIQKTITVIRYIFLSLLSFCLIGLGWYQEVFWYKEVFTGNGYDLAFSIITGASLSLLLFALSIKRKYILAGVVMLFSIGATVIGQNQLYTVKKQVYTEQTAKQKSKQELNNLYNENIGRLTVTIQEKDSLLPEDMKNRAMWNSNAVQPLLQEIRELKAEKKEYENLKADIILSDTVITEPKTSYDNFADDVPFISPNLVKYMFLVFISLFVALLAPTGGIILSTLYIDDMEVKKRAGRESRASKKEEKKPSTDPITLFANSAFRNEEKPPTLAGRNTVCKETGLSQNAFNKIHKNAMSLGLIVKKGNNMTIPKVSRSQFIMMYNNKQSAVSSGLAAVR